MRIILRVAALAALSSTCSTTPTPPLASVTTQRSAMVSITFDDGYMSAYTQALPILEQFGFKATWYIIINRSGPEYMRRSDLLSLAAKGQEIGAHTLNHFPLDTASDTQAQHEIQGSRDSLQRMGLGEVKSFAYPFGHYNSHTPEISKSAGFVTARTIDEGENYATTNPQLLKAWALVPNTTLSRIEQIVDKAVEDKSWLILCFHRIDEDGNSISVRHELLQGLLEYLSTKKISVVTMSEGYTRLQSK